MKNSVISLLLIVGMMALPAAAYAAFEASPWTEETTYVDKTTGKLEFALKNTLGGWTAMFSEPERYSEEGKNIFAGIGTGFGKALVYTVGGVLHLATFPIPLDVPLPDGGVNFD